ncbi:hypothetical protein GCM10007881_62920 [Mesorhizobium huakuii]|uniref:hypothetical protein n=1 Tax=Mesorhizobium huakuii TaxID=28104 RepID=UPI00235BF35A|nr:hypothetical protein [Mesorhizobium huakuii]GLQ82769.1 hypothetical protein GCM10007881_62920 [Mesorhizobium huakuii]
MGMTGRISVRINKYIDGQEITYGVPVRVRPIVTRADDKGHAVRRTDQERSIIDLLAPVARSYGSSTELDIGDYDVEAVLPSGETLSSEVLISADQTSDVVLEGDSSPNEWRSWAQFAGSRRPSAIRLALERRRDAPSHWRKTPEFAVSVGTRAHDQDHRSPFDPSSWNDWFNYLRFRHDHRSEIGEGPELRLDGNSEGIEVFREGGDGSLPSRIRLRQYGPDVTMPRSVGRNRKFVTVGSAAGTRIFALPWPWPSAVDTFGSFFDIMAVEEQGVLLCDPVLLDTAFGGLIAYLNAGQIQLAAEVLKQAEQALFEKNDNPIGAAAGGYVLLSAPDKGRERDWPHWLQNLAKRFPAMPDALILRARWLLEHGEKGQFQEAHQLLIDAFKRGVPYFTTGVVWLIEGLRRTAVECAICQERLAVVRGVARSMDLSQAFTSFSLARPESKRSALTDLVSDAPSANAVSRYETTQLTGDIKARIENWESEPDAPLLLPLYER